MFLNEGISPVPLSEVPGACILGTTVLQISDHRMRPKSLYDLLAPLYARFLPGFFERLNTRAVQRVGAGAPATILEVGVGPGRLLSEIAAKGKARVIGVDISRKMLGYARQAVRDRKGNAKVVQASGLALPFPDASFEAVVSVLFLGVLSEREIQPALNELTRVLAPGGRIVIASLKFTSPILRRLWMTAYQAIPDLVGKVRPVNIDAQLEPAGLRVIKEEDIPEFTGIRMLTLMRVRA